ncbi:MAG: hypothetical protein IKZ29_02690 [Clostridiales bacterium]|nr:hypothetical protein [Clostridiales bacterium]
MKTFKQLAAAGLVCAVILASAGCAKSGDSGSPSDTESETASETSEEDDGISVGDHIVFGNYQQKTDSDPEPIEWRVLEIKDDKALIITEYLLEPHVYNIEMEDVTWENSSLRKWLNGDFYDAAFSNSEKSHIQTVTIRNPDNPLYGTPGGNDTEDKVFCLSLEEVQVYFADTNDRMTAATDYAISRGASINEDNKLENGMKTGWWWLRTPASSANRAAEVDCFGNIDTVINADRVDGCLVFSEGICVRPAIWITLTDENSEEINEPEEPVVRRVEFGNALGYKRCYCELVSMGGNGFSWNLYNEDQEMIAMQFGFNDYEPALYSVDMDGDGTDELISFCVYGGDGAARVFVYRNNNGMIELGVFETDLKVSEYSMEYDSTEQKIILQNWTEEKETVLGIDDFTFSAFDPENFPW